MLKPGMKIRWRSWDEDEYIIVDYVDGDKVYPKDKRHFNPYYSHAKVIGPQGWIILEYPLAKNIKGRVRGYGSRKDIL